MLRRIAFASLCTLLLLIGAMARAAGPRLEVTPFLGSFAPYAWQPITVTVRNPADDPPISGEVRLSLTDHHHGSLGSWSRPVQIAPGGVARVVITTCFPDGALPVAEVSLVRGTGQTSATIATERFEGLRVRPENTIVILNLSRNPDALASLEAQATGFHVRGAELYHMPTTNQMAASAESHPRSSIRVVPFLPEELPTDALGLDSVVAIYQDETTVLTSEQKIILDRYTAAGGLLVTKPTTGAESVRATGLGVRAELRPENTTGWHEALHRKADRRSLLGRTSRMAFQGFNYGLGSSVVVGEGTKALPLSAFVLFLAVYLFVLVPVQYTVLKRLGKREWAWGVTPALAILFALAAYGFGQRGRSRESFLNVATIVEAEAGRPTGRALTRIGLFSPAYRNYDLGVRASGPTRLTSNGAGDAAESMLGGVPTLRDLSVPMWSIQQATALSEVELGSGLEITVRDGKTTLTNRTGRTIRGLLVNGKALGTLAPDQSGTLRLNSGSYITLPHTGFNPDTPEQRMKEQLGALLSMHKESQGAHILTVTGWLDAPLAEVSLNGKPTAPRHHATLLVVHATK
jgi:hypothetical protein